MAELGFRFNSVTFESAKHDEVKNLTFVRAERTLIADLSVDIGKNDRICVIGKNGKEIDLVALISQRTKPVAGEIIPSNCQMGYLARPILNGCIPTDKTEQEFSRLRPDMNYTDIRKTCGNVFW